MLIYVSILDERMPIIKKVNHCNAALDKEDASEIFYSALNQQSSCFMWNFFYDSINNNPETCGRTFSRKI